MANGAWILALFFGKLAFSAWLNVRRFGKNCNRCIVIKYSPFIEWTEGTDQEINTRNLDSNIEHSDANVAHTEDASAVRDHSHD